MIRLGGTKMSKSKGNLVAPEEIIDTLGADTLRLAHLSVKPPEEDVDWEDVGLEGCARFLHRVWRLGLPAAEDTWTLHDGPATAVDEQVRRATHRLVADVTSAFERWSYHVAVARFMAFVNEFQRAARDEPGLRRSTHAEAVDTLLLLLAPAAPHLSAELWSRRHDGEHVHERPWPVADESLLIEDTVTMVVQVDGKVRDRIEVAAGADEADCVAAALASPKVVALLDGSAPARVVARPPKVVNVVRS
jgi:leucyl-tRNA synthetase